jgi:arsenate reductase (thioredoxin)
MKRLLVLCTHNSARSQMAEGWLRKLARDAPLEAEILSAGTEKTLVKPPAIQVMGEIDIDLSSHWSKTIEEIPEIDNIDAVITVCDSANDACPMFPGNTRRYHVSLPDPSGGDLDRWRQSRDQVGRVMKVLIDELASGRWADAHALDLAKEPV